MTSLTILVIKKLYSLRVLTLQLPLVKYKERLKMLVTQTTIQLQILLFLNLLMILLVKMFMILMLLVNSILTDKLVQKHLTLATLHQLTMDQTEEDFRQLLRKRQPMQDKS